ncbi:hypothetical protein [Streptomyces sp. NRRL F-5123]|uniref:hypothetical protein n=1 Tax=Streptomyces sp. NRRL F-5123 TaxID=1463856 RepID=UPI0004E1BDB5|nr:hypothetical protein [Streptomyces sp. NRRL F-5123]
MANSYAQSILRTTSTAEALDIVRRLLDLADTSDLSVDFDARVFEEPVLDALLELLPDTDWWTETEGADEASSDAGDDPHAHLPLYISECGVPPEAVDRLIAASGTSPASIRWDFWAWPAAPEAGLDRGGARGAYITLCLNAQDIDLTEPAADHSLFVHVAQVEAERAPWLAARVGLRVIGELVMAPV